jgi:2-dehydropantoate 2-reductase
VREEQVADVGGPRIAVLGAGANGGGIGADLVRSGHDVTFIEQWPAHVEAMRKRGIRVEFPEVTVTTPVRVLHLCEVATLRQPFDVVFVLLKAYDTRWGCELVSPLVAPNGIVVGLQNGMTVEDVAAAVGRERTLGAVIEVSSAMFEPGVVERHSPHARSWFTVGAVHPSAQARAEEVAAILRAAGTVEVTDDIRSAKWMKLVVNAAELVPSGILDLPIAETVRIPAMHDLMVRAGHEAVDSALATGNRMVPIFGHTSVDPESPHEYVTDLLDALLTHYVLPHTKSTVLQDWMKGRHSEVDEINGLVTREHVERGASAPVNAAATAIARSIEAGELSRGVHNIALLEELAAAGRA